MCTICVRFIKFAQVFRGSLHTCLDGKAEPKALHTLLSLASSKFTLEDIVLTRCLPFLSIRLAVCNRWTGPFGFMKLALGLQRLSYGKAGTQTPCLAVVLCC